MGALYLIAGMTMVGVAVELASYVLGDARVGAYEYHFAEGVGAVFGTRN